MNQRSLADFKDHIKKTIASGEVEETRLALQEMRQAVPLGTFDSDALSLVGQLNRVQKERNSGLISNEEYQLRINRTYRSIIDLLQELPENAAEFNEQEALANNQDPIIEGVSNLSEEEPLIGSYSNIQQEAPQAFANEPAEAPTIDLTTQVESLQEQLEAKQISEVVIGLDGLLDQIEDTKLQEQIESLVQSYSEWQSVANSKRGLQKGERERRENDLSATAKNILTEIAGTIRQDTTPEAETDTPTELPKGTLIETRNLLHSDQWAQEDYLGYEIFAEVIAKLINDSDSRPPLTVAIIAPWGHGKTTLMNYVRRRIVFPDKYQKSSTADIQQEEISTFFTQLMADSDDRHADAKKIKTWRKELRNEKKDKLQTNKTVALKKRPTVWFNPWQYQSSKQIWAGMAHAIITQLVRHLDPLEQEKFWFQLQLRRLDRQAIRQEIHKSVLIRLLPNLLVLLLSLLAFIAASLLMTSLPPLLQGVIHSALGGISLWAIGNGIIAYRENLQKGIEDKYDQFLNAPDYTSKLGMYHDVNEDMQRVFSLLVKKDEPVVIFIDDLDRCSPRKVAEVIEAINLIMNGSFRQKCYFVLGMDAQVVAAALDVAYKEMHGKLADREKSMGSVGWYFLDKFIQLPFIIPTLDGDEKSAYLQRLFRKETEKPKTQQDNATINEAELRRKARDAYDNVKRSRSNQAQESRGGLTASEEKVFDNLFIEVALEENKDSSAILEQVRAYAVYLDDSPRGLKRFANMLRFYTSIQQLRDSKGQAYASTESLAKWLTISLRWPQLVRWIQWTREQQFVQSVTPNPDKPDQPLLRCLYSQDPAEKARELDQLLQRTLQGQPTQANEHELERIFKERWLPVVEHSKHLPWLQDKDLFRLLYDKNEEASEMEKAIVYDIW